MHSSLTTTNPFYSAANAGAGVPPPPSETPFCAGCVDWEKPTIKLTADSVSEARLKEIAALTPGQSLLIEADVPKAEIQKALELLKPGIHLMLNYLNSGDEDDEFFYDIVRSIPFGSTVHLTEEHSEFFAYVLANKLKTGCIIAFREEAAYVFLDEFTESCHVFSILPEHNLPTAKHITKHATSIGAPICFEEGTSGEIIYVLLTQKKRPRIALPTPSVWSMESMIDELTVRRPFTFVPHSSTTVEEMQRLARMCHVGKCELALDKRHTREQVIIVANSLLNGASLFLSTDEQDLRLEVAKRMWPGSQLHLSDIKSVEEISDILAASRENMSVVLPISMHEHIAELQRNHSEDGYEIITISDEGSFDIRKETIDKHPQKRIDKPPQVYNKISAQLRELWASSSVFEPSDFKSIEDFSLARLETLDNVP